MIRHIMKDGRELQFVDDLVVTAEDAPNLRKLFEEINKKRKERTNDGYTGNIQNP